MILFDRQIEIMKTEDSFVVEIPLIEPEEAHKAIKKMEQLPLV
jgi:hypothetical protein